MLLLVADAVEVVVIVVVVVGGLLLVMLKHEMLVLDVLVKTEGIIINIADTTTAAAPCGRVGSRRSDGRRRHGRTSMVVLHLLVRCHGPADLEAPFIVHRPCRRRRWTKAQERLEYLVVTHLEFFHSCTGSAVPACRKKYQCYAWSYRQCAWCFLST